MSGPGDKIKALNWRRLLVWLLALAVIVFLSQVLLSSWSQIVASGFVFRFDWPLLLLSLVLLVLARAMATESWRRVLLALGGSLSYRLAIYVWYVSNLTRYVPGNVWQVATLMVLTEREGVSKTNALLSQAVYSVIALSLAGLFGLWLLPIPAAYQPFVLLLLLAVIIVLAQPKVFRLVVSFSRWALARMVARLPRGRPVQTGGYKPASRAGPELSFGGLLLVHLASCGNWLFNGIAFFLFIRSLSPLSLDRLPVFISIYSAAYFIGYASFITPSGLGFREGAMALLLAPYFPMAVAVAIAFAARIWMTVSEFLGLGLAALIVPRSYLPPLPFFGSRSRPPYAADTSATSPSSAGLTGAAGPASLTSPSSTDVTSTAGSTSPTSLASGDTGTAAPATSPATSGSGSMAPATTSSSPESGSAARAASSVVSLASALPSSSPESGSAARAASSVVSPASALPSSFKGFRRWAGGSAAGPSPETIIPPLPDGERGVRGVRGWLPLAAVWLLILAYSVFFSALSIDRHRALLTHASDLGQIDQAIYNTLQGRPLEFTDPAGVQQLRLVGHVEPLYLPLSLLFLVYDNVEALLIAQSFAIAIGALAIFWIARKRLALSLRGNPSLAAWAGVGFAAVYLLFPSLESANLAEFHAVTLAPALLLFAYNYGDERAWGRFALFSFLALAVKEEIAMLVFVMALWFAFDSLDLGVTIAGRLKFITRRPGYLLRAWQPLSIALLATLWGALTVFVIIPHFSALGHSPFTCRYVVSPDCPPVDTRPLLGERLSYIIQLLASSGWIAVLDPLSILLGLPILAANLISNFPAQFSGTFHYSAPVAPYFILAAIGGAARVLTWIEREKDRRKAPVLLTLILLLGFAYHLVAGYTPFGGQFDWPQVTAHDMLVDRFVAEIPRDARVSTTSSLNPHLSHRLVVYRYPLVKDADYVLLDVDESNHTNPNDFRAAYDTLLDHNTFGVVDSSDGYILLKRGAPARPFADEFYSLFRADGRSPQVPAAIDFGEIRFYGYDVLTDAYGRGAIRTYWERRGPLDKNYSFYIFYPGDDGAPRQDVPLLPSPLALWYPPRLWKLGEKVIGETVPFDLGDDARVGLAVLEGTDFGNTAGRIHPQVISPPTLPVSDDGTWVQLTILQRHGDRYIPK